MLVGSCAQCGAPATLRCAMCGRTLCRLHLDADERLCPDCLKIHRRQKGPTGVPLPPSHRTVRDP